MKNVAVSIFLMAAFASCAHAPKGPEDLVIGKTYKTIGAALEEARVCTVVVKNIITVVPSPMGPLSTQEAMQTPAMVCGDIDCSAMKPDAKGFDCIEFGVLQPPQSDK